MEEFLVTIIVIVIFVALCSIRQINQYERGILFIRGKYAKVLNPGWHVIWPVFQSCKKIDIRIYYYW
jgi:regulator of protease activity HflC (stomatin/prohibitin superfamily)